jgi:hypothetical protein
VPASSQLRPSPQPNKRMQLAGASGLRNLGFCRDLEVAAADARSLLGYRVVQAGRLEDPLLGTDYACNILHLAFPASAY